MSMKIDSKAMEQNKHSMVMVVYFLELELLVKNKPTI